MQVEFRDVQMRYREHLPKVLHGLSVTVPPGSRCGVVRDLPRRITLTCWCKPPVLVLVKL